MPVPTPKERPDLYDDFDYGNAKYPEANKEAVTPPHVRKLLEERERAKTPKPE